MSEIYSSASGSYSNYLSERQNDSITKTIKEESAKQNMWNLMYTGAVVRSVGEVGQKIDSVNYNIQRMSTGIQTSINQNTYMVAASSTLLANSFNEGFNELNNTLDLGFGGVQNAIGSMSASMSAGFDRLQKTVNTWGTEICEKLDAIHDIVNNPLLTASRELFRRAQANAQKQFYEEALEDITQAVEKNKTDYLSWALMGKIYLFGMSEFSNVVDVQKALESFINACKYITPDIDESEEAKKMAAEFYFYVGYANYILSNESRLANNIDDVTKYLEASVKANAKSYALSSAMLESAYNQARALTLLNQNEKAISILEEVIRADGLYSIKALGDSDFKSIEDNIVSLIKNLRDECQQKTKELLTEFSNDYELIGGEYCESIKKLIVKCEELIASESPYLDIRAGYEAFGKEFEVIKKSKHPMDIQVYENKICKDYIRDSDGRYIISKSGYKLEGYYFENKLETRLTKAIYLHPENWEETDCLIDMVKDDIREHQMSPYHFTAYDGIEDSYNPVRLYLSRKVYKNQILINIIYDHLSENGFNKEEQLETVKDFDKYSSNRNESLYLPTLSYTFLQSKYGETGKVILIDSVHKSEYRYSQAKGYGLWNEDLIDEEAFFNEEIYEGIERKINWKIDNNTILCLEPTKRMVVYQSGIVLKKDLQEIKERPLLEERQKQEEKRLQEEKKQEDKAKNIEFDKRLQESLEKNRLWLKRERKKKCILALIILIGIIFSIPLVKLGGILLQKCGYVIFGSLCASLIGTIFSLAKDKMKESQDWHGPLASLAPIIYFFYIWIIPAIIAGGLKIGLNIGHPVAGTLISILISLIVFIVDGIMYNKI
ncbi:MAG: hypothetical protein IJ688_01915 [Treponema sp.]|nr:hypothetical protein [Treponema sp.]